MTNEKKERIKALEKELAPIFRSVSSLDEKYRIVKGAVSVFLSGRLFTQPDDDNYMILNKNSEKIIELGRLYDELMYQLDEDEKTLSYLFCNGMSTEEKMKALSNAWWTATNSGYSDAMANRLMAGEEDGQTERWELNCRNKWAIDRYYEYLEESVKNTL